jgi:hypothetical protein
MEEKKDQRKFAFFKKSCSLKKKILVKNLTSNVLSVKEYIEHEAPINFLTK